MTENLKTENSLLNQQSKNLYSNRFNSKNPDDVAFLNNLLKKDEPFIPFDPKNPESVAQFNNFIESVSQYSQASSSNPSQITEENNKKTAEEYLGAFQRVWLNSRGEFIKI
jgi:hypothetical protein